MISLTEQQLSDCREKFGEVVNGEGLHVAGSWPYLIGRIARSMYAAGVAAHQQDTRELKDASTQLESVLCDPEGRCVIAGSEGDRAAVDAALRVLRDFVEKAG